MEYSLPMSKVCNAADFFSQGYIDTIKGEFNEVPRLHRKQWEFGMIFLALKRMEMLDDSKVGLSMGSGNEVVLYAIARYVKHLTATDLYSSESLWDCAKAANPDEFIRKNKPFPVDDTKLSALNMDMRDLVFEDNTFDFAYSACAFEHIGEDADFLKHLDEVYRVLKDGGVYVMTTEFTFENETIPIPNNYLFSAEHLNRLIAESMFTPEKHFDARITEQSANFPIPGQVDDLSYMGEQNLAKALVDSNVIPHVQVLYGKHPFTSCMFILRKDAAKQSKEGIVFDGLVESRALLQSYISRYRTMIQTELSLYPFSFLRGRVSPYFSPHRLQAEKAGHDQSNAIFHTNYYWFGGGIVKIHISMTPLKIDHDEACSVELRVHRFKTNDPAVAECSYHDSVLLPSSREIQREITAVADDDYAYAVLAVMQKGTCLFSDIQVRVLPSVQTVSSSGDTIQTPPAVKAPEPVKRSFLRKVQDNVARFLNG